MLLISDFFNRKKNVESSQLKAETRCFNAINRTAAEGINIKIPNNIKSDSSSVIDIKANKAIGTEINKY